MMLMMVTKLPRLGFLPFFCRKYSAADCISSCFDSGRYAITRYVTPLAGSFNSLTTVGISILSSPVLKLMCVRAISAGMRAARLFDTTRRHQGAARLIGAFLPRVTYAPTNRSGLQHPARVVSFYSSLKA